MNKERQFVWENEGALKYFMKTSMPKNLLTYTAETTTTKGVTFTVNNDGTITVSGTNTATSAAVFVITTFSNLNLPDGDYILSGCPGAGSAYGYRMDITRTGQSSMNDIGGGVHFKVGGSAYTPNQIRIVVMAGTVCDNLVFKPMIRDANIYDGEYQEYKTPVDASAIAALQGEIDDINTTIGNINTVLEEVL